MKAETRAQIESLFERYPQKRGALLPAIYLLQREKGHVDAEGTRELAALFELQPIQVLEVLSFYNMFYTEPQGRHHVYVCTNLPCSLRGSRTLLRQLEAHLGVHGGGTTADGRVTICHEECLGSCGTALMMSVDGTYHENLDFEAARRIIDGLE